jgi:polyphosphate kinase 2
MSKNGKNGKNGSHRDHHDHAAKYPLKLYEAELLRLQGELVKMKEWVRTEGKRVVVIFEGRDAAGKGGVIKRITEYLNPRVCSVAALPKPTEREQSQWYFQRYIEHLPAGGHIVLFDRSWYTRAGVEHVLGFCTKEQHRAFLEQCPAFEHYVTNAGIHLIKYWLEVGNKEQARRFEARIEDPLRQWKLSPTDLESRRRWYDYSRARDKMLEATDTDHAPWYIVPSDDKKRARLNLIAHLLSLIPYKDVPRDKVKMLKRSDEGEYDDQKSLEGRRMVPQKY